ncbi:MAG: VanW family protein [Nocardioides sp.]
MDQESRVGDDKRERAGGRVVWFVLLGLVLLVGAGWAGAYLYAGDKVPRGTSVAGVDIGGRTQEEAESALEQGLARRAGAPIEVSIDDTTRTIEPAEAGLSVDYAASVAEGGGEKTWDPRRLWDFYTDGDEIDAVVAVDDAALEAAVERLGAGLDRQPRDGALTFGPGGVRTVEPKVGEALDAAAARAAIEAAYLEDDPSLTLELSERQPAIDADDVQEALDSFANPALSGAVTLVFDGSPIRLQPRDFAPALSMKPDGGELVPEVDGAVLTALVDEATSGAGDPVDATVAVVDGKPKVVPAKPGVTFDPDDVSSAFLDLVTRPEGEREIEVEASVDQPDFTTADAKALQIREKVSEFTTFFPYAEYRNINIGRAAEIVDGTLLKPDDVFSLNDIVGERTIENGFVEGFVISDGILKLDLGGGVSQMATTTFNAMFFAGLKDVEHKPHSFYIDRYPVGREATVAFGAVDLRFANDTPYGVLVEAVVVPSTPATQGSVTVSMYSTKIWDITTSASERYAYVSPATRTLSTPDCEPNTGYSGFQIDVSRFFRKAGETELVREESFHTDYTPADTVICE